MFVTMILYLWEIEVRGETTAAQKPARLEAEAAQPGGNKTLRKDGWKKEWGSHCQDEIWEYREQLDDPELDLGAFADAPTPRGGVRHTGGTAVIRKTILEKKKKPNWDGVAM